MEQFYFITKSNQIVQYANNFVLKSHECVAYLSLTAVEAADVPGLAESLLLLVEIDTRVAARTFWRTLYVDLHLVHLVRQACNALYHLQ